MAVLDELLDIKTFRQRQADAALQTARARLAEAHRTEESRRQAFEQFVNQATADVEAWYGALMGRQVKVHEINALHLDIAILRAEEETRKQAHLEARKGLESAQTVHVSAAESLREATTVREKFLELAQRHNAAIASELERREELEFEELASIVREREAFTTEENV